MKQIKYSLKKEYIMEDYQPMIKASIAELNIAGSYLENPHYSFAEKANNNPQALLDKKINALMQTRQQEVKSGQFETDNKKYVSNFKSITDQFYFVYKTTQDLHKISKTISPVS